MASAALARDRVFHYLPRQEKFYSLSFYLINCYIILKGVLLLKTWASQQHKYFKHGGREFFASKKMTLGQVVPNFTGPAPKYFKFSDENCELLYVVFYGQNNLETKKTCRNKLTPLSGSFMFRLKEKFSVFLHFFDQRNFSIEDCSFLHCSALELTNIFVQLSLDITFHEIECGVTTCPGYGESSFPYIVKGSLIIIVLRLKKIRYCSIVARGSLKILAYHSLPKYWRQKIQISWNKMCDN